MERKIKIGYWIFIFIVFLVIMFMVRFCKDLPESKGPFEYSKVINFKKINQVVYIKTRMWGLLGGHSCVFFTEKDSNVPDEKNDIIFQESERMYYKQQGSDTLLIYLPSGSFSDEEVISQKIGCVNVLINKFKVSMNSKYENDYKDMGLSRIDCYNGIE